MVNIMKSFLLHWICYLLTVDLCCGQSYPFRNMSLSLEDRVEDLVWRLTLEEMVEQMAYGGAGSFKPSPGIERLGIEPYNFYTVCMKGVKDMPATAFPQTIGLAAAFSTDLVYRMAAATAVEARAFYNQARKMGDYKNNMGASCLGPFINVARHPLWGRIKEVYGEDPYLSGSLAAAFVEGMHGLHPKYSTATSGCLVIDVHSGPDNIPVSRLSFDAKVSERDMRLTYLPSFKLCVKADPLVLMCSYNSINGVPACANKWLMEDITRKEYGFKGYVISDRGAIEYIYSKHNYTSSFLTAAVAALEAGVNMDLPYSPYPAYLLLTDAVKQGLLAFETVVERVKPLFYTRMRLGEFDPEEMNPYNQIGLDQVLSEEHIELATIIATKTFVLLKNMNNILPIGVKPGSMSIVGPMSDNLAEMYSSYSPTLSQEYGYTVYRGLRDMAEKVHLASGCDNSLCAHYDSMSIMSTVKAAQLTIVCLGTGNLMEGESRDRSDLLLPANQTRLLKDVVTYSSGNPIVLLLFSGGPVDVSWAKSLPQVSAILQVFFPAQSTGQALARVLFDNNGTVVSPAGRLPYTWYNSATEAGPITDYSMTRQTYRYFQGDPLYSFGYGLSYTQFQYSNLTLGGRTVTPGSDVTGTVYVHNVGMYDSDEVTQLYISWRNVTVPMPHLQLVYISRTLIVKGTTVVLKFTIKAEQFQVWDDSQHAFVYQKGEVSLYCGGQLPGQTTTVPSNVLHTLVYVQI